MRVLVTGHKGYIGTVMVPMLQARGHSVLGIDSDLYRNSTYGTAPEPVDEIIKDVRDIEKSDLEGVDAVVSLAAFALALALTLSLASAFAFACVGKQVTFPFCPCLQIGQVSLCPCLQVGQLSLCP